MNQPFRPQDAPWAGGPRGIDELIAEWERTGTCRDIGLDETLPATPKRAVPIPESLPEQVRRALTGRGIAELYTHQIAALEHALRGESFVVATPTASGKSLCYNLPVLSALADDPDARALYLFPTKALSRDQEEAVRALLGEAGLTHGAITFDGDTPGDVRRAARERGGVILSNPDMLHAGILPHHAGWARFFANLRYVVVDELHGYRGVFGSHLANVMRRLVRVARFHGSDPVFIGASATIGNPAEHASRVFGRDVAVIDESGAPTGERRVLVYNPPIVNAELGMRASYLKSAVRLTCDLVRAGVTTLVFGQSRNAVEVMLKYLRDRLGKDIGPGMIHAYRGGYLPNQRRAIERKLRAGEIRCVVATNALELGIDIGALDAVVCAGYPGSLAGTWQRFGRAGRREGKSLGLLVTSSNPLDQYVAREPRQLLHAGVEHARIDPDNVEILLQHLKCAAFELPFEEGDRFGEVPAETLGDALAFLAQHRVVHEGSDAAGKQVWHWASDAYPASSVSLRSLSWDNFVIIDLDGDRTIAEMDWRSTHTMLHEQAIYQHAAEQYQVERLDFENHKAYVRKVAPDYYTTAQTHTKVTVTEQEDESPMSWSMVVGTGEHSRPLQAGYGEVSVVEKVVGYKKIKFHTHENVGYGEVDLPEMQMHTTSFWLTVPEDVVAAFMESELVPRATVIDALRGLLNSLHVAGALGLMTDPRDLGKVLGDHADPEEFGRGQFGPSQSGPGRFGPGQSGPGEGARGTAPRIGTGNAFGFDPTLFLFDRIPGGVGLASRLFQEREALFRRAHTSIVGCACEAGCPACIGPSTGVVGERELGKRRPLVVALLNFLGSRALQ